MFVLVGRASEVKRERERVCGEEKITGEERGGGGEERRRRRRRGRKRFEETGWRKRKRGKMEDRESGVENQCGQREDRGG